jgi:hypothetical protein
VSVLVVTAERAFHGPVALGGGDDFIQPEKTHQEDAHKGDRDQEVPPAGLEDGILHLRLQMLRYCGVNFFSLLGYRPKLENIQNPR